MKPKITYREVQTNVNVRHPTPPQLPHLSRSINFRKQVQTNVSMPHPAPTQTPHLSRSINFKNRSSHTFGFTPVGKNI